MMIMLLKYQKMRLRHIWSGFYGELETSVIRIEIIHIVTA